MTPLARIIRHEWRLLTTDGSLWPVVAIFALAIGYGIYNGARWIRFQQGAVAEAAREERERFDLQQTNIAKIEAGALKVSPFADPRNPQTAGSRLGARYAVMPTSPLAALSVGQSDLFLSYFKITSDARETVTAGAELENPHRLLTGRFDLAFVVIYLYPLLILAISYNALSGEKEQGTLGMVLAQPVSLRTVLIGKLSLRFGVLLATVALLAGVMMLFAGVDLDADGATTGVMLWTAAIAAYGFVWFALATLVTSYGRASSTNAMTLAALWLSVVILIPSLLNMVATTAYPVPSRVEMIQAMREASDDANQQGSKLLSRYYEDHPELAAGGAEQAMSDFNVVRVAVHAEVAQRVRPVLDRYEAQTAGQQRMVSSLRILSPAIIMQDALNDISGTGTSRHRHFMQQVGAFHEQWRAHFVPLIFRRAQVQRYDSLPVFSYRDEPSGAVAQRVAGAVLWLLAGGAVVAAAGMLKLRRFPLS